MRRIYVVTFYSRNYGSALQAMALQFKLRDLGGEPFVLRQINDDRNKSKLYLALRTMKRFMWQFIPEKHYGITKKIKFFLEKPVFNKRYRKIDEFCNKYIRFEDFDMNQYIVINDDSVRYLVGSDQVWNTIDRKINPVYLLNFKNASVETKYSYAASIGLESISEKQKKYYINALKDFQCISLREKSAAECFLDTSIYEKIRRDIDPTMLYDGDFWSRYASTVHDQDKYIFVYMLRPDEKLFTMARSLAKKHNLKIFYAGLTEYHQKDIVSVNGSGVEEFLGLLKNAYYVVTNSFHGTCFSILFKRNFVSVSIESTGSRARNLLESLGLNNRIIHDSSEISRIEEDIDYIEVELKLSVLRKDSTQYLERIIR